MDEQTISTEVAAEAPVEEIETGEVVETTEEAGESSQEQEFDEKELALSDNRKAELRRKNAEHAKVLQQIEERNKQLAEAKAKLNDTPAANDDDDDDDFADPDIKSVKKELAELRALYQEERSHRTSREEATYQKQLADADESVTSEIVSIMKDAADKVLKLEGSQRDFMHDQLELNVRAFREIARREGLDVNDAVVEQFTKDTITNYRTLFGFAAEKQLKDAANVREQTKVKPGSGSIGTKAPPDERTLSRDEQIRLTEERVRRAEEATRTRH